MDTLNKMVRKLKKKFPANYCSIAKNHEGFVTFDRVKLSYELYIAETFIKGKLNYKQLVKEVDKLLEGE